MIDPNNNNWTKVAFLKGEVVFKQDTLNSNILFLDSGLIKIHKECKFKKSMILQLVTEGNYIDLFSSFSQETRAFSATALIDSEIYFINKDEFQSVIKSHSSYTIDLLTSACKNGIYVSERLLYNQQKQLPGRIASIIVYFSESLYKSNSFKIPLTRKELAEFVGTSREGLIRTLSEFKNDKLIDILEDGKKIRINSMPLLKKLSEIG